MEYDLLVRNFISYKDIMKGEIYCKIWVKNVVCPLFMKINENINDLVIHRDVREGPAVEIYFKNDKLFDKNIEVFVENGNFYNGESLWYYNQKISMKNNKFHSPYKPILYDFLGRLSNGERNFSTIENWIINGEKYTLQVRYYLMKNDIDWREMSIEDFDIMWMNIL